jgi:hypothetical protein
LTTVFGSGFAALIGSTISGFAGAGGAAFLGVASGAATSTGFDEIAFLPWTGPSGPPSEITITLASSDVVCQRPGRNANAASKVTCTANDTITIPVTRSVCARSARTWETASIAISVPPSILPEP